MPGRERETGAAVALDAQTLWKGAQIAPLMSSFSDVALDAAREAAPELPRAFLVDQWRDDWRDCIVRLGCIALDIEHTLLSRARIDELHGAGVRVATWTPNDPLRVADLLAWGVDTVITDAIDVISPQSG